MSSLDSLLQRYNEAGLNGTIDPSQLGSLRAEVLACLDKLQAAALKAGSPLMNLLTSLVLESAHAHKACAGAAEAQEPAPGRSGWKGVLERMLCSRPWTTGPLVCLDKLPLELWPLAGVWAFQVPPLGLQAGQKAALVAQLQSLLGELETALRANSGSAAVRAVLHGYTDSPLYETLLGMDGCGDCGGLVERHGKLLQTLASKRAHALPPPLVFPASGRKLKVGFLAESFEPSPLIHHCLALLQGADQEEISLHLLCLDSLEGEFPSYCAGCTRNPGTRLPEDTLEACSLVATLELDVLVFAGELHRPDCRLLPLATQRLAPLQVHLGSRDLPSGLPQVDALVMNAAAAEQAPAAKRALVLEGPAHCYYFPTRNDDPVSASLAADLNLPAEVPLFAVILDGSAVPPDLASLLRTLLAALPTLHIALVVHLPAERLEAESGRLGAALDRALDNPDQARRLIVFPVSGNSILSAELLLPRCAALLDSFGPGMCFWSALAMNLGVPPLVIDGPHDRRHGVARSLVALGHASLVFSDAPALAARASELCGNTALRGELSTQLQNDAKSGLGCFDHLASADAFYLGLEQAFGLLHELGPDAFRRNPPPLSAPAGLQLVSLQKEAADKLASLDLTGADAAARLALQLAPEDAQTRKLRGRILLSQGRHARAADYLLASSSSGTADADTWLWLSRAFTGSGQDNNAVQCLSTCFQIDPNHVEALLDLITIAERLGLAEEGEEARQHLLKVAPTDPRVLALGSGPAAH